MTSSRKNIFGQENPLNSKIFSQPFHTLSSVCFLLLVVATYGGF